MTRKLLICFLLGVFGFRGLYWLLQWLFDLPAVGDLDLFARTSLATLAFFTGGMAAAFVPEFWEDYK